MLANEFDWPEMSATTGFNTKNWVSAAGVCKT